ncbi:uncharacterized protein LOC129921563 [Episyrphus balteatus]|uniref:uncharacterized protein LOC129905082 n=1 Tax=Episyrphus balteatus TaxID=286459 RepID=UPI002485F886|nr:uncharacterized protein LOC129905082 [Episyrphus balteatus]XP_055859424.1 uncharacterized protein LOC129921563 [Episyrphus balteatus]
MIPHVRNLKYLFQSRLLSPQCIRLLTTSTPNLAKTAPIRKGNTQNDEPMQFFGSGAASWRAKDTRSGGADEALWYQQYVISGSVAIFLIYFCILREENDIDQKLEGSLYDHIEGLEEQQLVIRYKYNRDNNIDTADIEKRLLELGIDARKFDQQ